jgi:hypothetical protein
MKREREIIEIVGNHARIMNSCLDLMEKIGKREAGIIFVSLEEKNMKEKNIYCAKCAESLCEHEVFRSFIHPFSREWGVEEFYYCWNCLNIVEDGEMQLGKEESLEEE